MSRARLAGCLCFLAETEMFGARVVRQKRERERADRNLNDLDRKQHSVSRNISSRKNKRDFPHCGTIMHIMTE